jgi:hypothetical protein
MNKNVPRTVRPGVLLVYALLAMRLPLLAGNDGTTPLQPPPTPDKSGYTLFHPTPVSALRDFSPDRPSQADGPFTIDAGHLQLELSFANYTFDSHNPERAPVRTDQWNPLPTVVRIGVTNRVEIDLQYDSYLNVRTRDRATRPLQTTTMSGFGDLTLRSKINLWGNDGGVTALAILPSLKIPTNTAALGNNSVEGNVQLPFNLNLPADFKLGLESGIGFVRNSQDTRYVAQFLNAAVLSHPVIVKELQGYVEFYSEVNTEHGTPVSAQVDVGLTYQIGNNLQLDGGCNIGVTRAVPDYQPFAGLAVRF